MAMSATKNPTLHDSPISGATAVAATIERERPRSVFDEPKRGLPSANVAPSVDRKGQRFPQEFFDNDWCSVGHRQQGEELGD
jgi:hypothetical protein